ncbi:MAG TPA: hypothetical protein VGX76_24100 [Pirellulales bacterium]|nr:hypothetical protein [Pirellulales bacterium]
MTGFTASDSTEKPAWSEGFLALLPAIYDQVRYAFRGLRPDALQEAIQETLASAAVAYARLHDQGRADIAYATPLAKFAVRQFRAGRRVGGRLDRNDVLSRHAQRHHKLLVERLDRRDPSGAWKEILVEDRRSTPAETAAARLDFGDWLARLCGRDRGIVAALATGETGRETARMFGLTAGRISQLRTELRRNWKQFQGEPTDDVAERSLAAC